MVSVLRTLQADWNALVPQAQALGIRRVRTLNAPLETIDYRRGKLDWLRQEIARLGGLQGLAERVQSTTALTPVQEPSELTDADIAMYTFGVELELLMPVGMSAEDLAARIVRDAGVRCASEGYNHATGSYWKLVTDGSLGDYTRGRELVSPVLQGPDGLDALRRVCLVLKAVGCKVTKKCGFHVHVGARNWYIETVKDFVRMYARAEQHIDQFMAPSRRANSNMYCATIRHYVQMTLNRAMDMANVARALGQDAGGRGSGRYKKLNLQSWWQHGTVEVRHHQGTVEADKACAWVRFVLFMALAANRRTPDAFETPDALYEHLRLPSALRTFYAGRVEYFRQAEQRAQVQATRRQVGVRTGRGFYPEQPVQPVVDQRNLFDEAGEFNLNQAYSRRSY